MFCLYLAFCPAYWCSASYIIWKRRFLKNGFTEISKLLTTYSHTTWYCQFFIFFSITVFVEIRHFRQEFGSQAGVCIDVSRVCMIHPGSVLAHLGSVFLEILTPDVSVCTLNVSLQTPGCVNTNPWMSTIFRPEPLLKKQSAVSWGMAWCCQKCGDFRVPSLQD